MKQIKIEIYRKERFVFGRVLDMPEEVRGNGKIAKDNDFTLSSSRFPDLTTGALHLKGKEQRYDDTWFSCNCRNEAEAKELVWKVTKIINKWNKQNKEILDEEERAYLSTVIKPWKNRIKYISKQTLDEEEYIFIIYDDKECMHLPEFTSNSMYKGMTIDEPYTLKDLGLE